MKYINSITEAIGHTPLLKLNRIGKDTGANVAVALRIAKLLGPGKNVVTTIVDRRDRYLSETPNERYVV